jgi:hypothetical protein
LAYQNNPTNKTHLNNLKYRVGDLPTTVQLTGRELELKKHILAWTDSPFLKSSTNNFMESSAIINLKQENIYGKKLKDNDKKTNIKTNNSTPQYTRRTIKLQHTMQTYQMAPEADSEQNCRVFSLLLL